MNTNKRLERFEALRDLIVNSSSVDPLESAANKQKRIKKLLASYPEFCKYYFPHYCTSEMAWFHKRVFNRIYKNPCTINLLQWFRGAAKSTHANVMFPLFLKFNGRLTGMITAAANSDNAEDLLADLQAELEVNARILNDFGPQKSIGNWEEGFFATRDDIPFKAFGKGQTPRGTRFRNNRPNYAVVDDFDTEKSVKNDRLSKEGHDWVKEALLAAIIDTSEWWLVVPQNKFNKNAITALLEESDSETYVSKVNILNDKGEVSWPEKYTPEDVKVKITALGYLSSQRELFNKTITEGTEFKDEWMTYGTRLPFKSYDALVVIVIKAVPVTRGPPDRHDLRTLQELNNCAFMQLHLCSSIVE